MSKQPKQFAYDTRAIAADSISTVYIVRMLEWLVFPRGNTFAIRKVLWCVQKVQWLWAYTASDGLGNLIFWLRLRSTDWKIYKIADFLYIAWTFVQMTIIWIKRFIFTVPLNAVCMMWESHVSTRSMNVMNEIWATLRYMHTKSNGLCACMTLLFSK